MASRASLNKVLLIGNLTRDPELRYTPSGAAVCTFGIATNRYYTASDGEKKEETEFIKIVSWNKLAELCSQLLSKGRKVYVEGRLQTRNWETPDGQPRQTTEVVIDDMRILDSKRGFGEGGYEEASDVGKVAVSPSGAVKANGDGNSEVGEESSEKKKTPIKSKETSKRVTKKSEVVEIDAKKADSKSEEDVDLDDLPF